MKFPTILGIIALTALSNTAGAQATTAKTSTDCVSRDAAASTGGKTTTIESVKVPAGNPMPPLAAGEPDKFSVSVLVDTNGRPDSTTIQLPAGLDSYSANSIRNVLPGWHFVPAQVGSCPVPQVVKLTFSRK
jgi:hypothetical protein